MWSDHGIDVTLMEPSASLFSCPLSNVVLGGSKTLTDITSPRRTGLCVACLEGGRPNGGARWIAAAVVALLTGRAPNDMPIYNNTCYSFVSDEDAVHVASVHRYDPEKKNMVTVAGSGGVSSAANALQGRYALAWAHNIWADTLA
jgi:hypothetical protein